MKKIYIYTRYSLVLFFILNMICCCEPTVVEPNNVVCINPGFTGVDGYCRCIDGLYPYGEVNCLSYNEDFDRFHGNIPCGCDSEVMLYIYETNTTNDKYNYRIIRQDATQYEPGGYGLRGRDGYYQGADTERRDTCYKEGYACYGKFFIDYPTTDDTLRGEWIFFSYERDVDGNFYVEEECSIVFTRWKP